MAMQTVERDNNLNFFKWKSVGDSITVTVTEMPVWDKPNQFGSKDNFFIGVDEDGQKHNVPLPFDAAAKVKKVEESIVLGQTRFQLTFESKKLLPPKVGGDGKARQFKTFSVGVEGLKDS
jgi:hypothetical protein